MLLTYYLLRNEVIMARKYAYRALNQTCSEGLKVDIHNSLGLSYTFDTYFQGMHHLKEALKIAKKHNLTNKIYALENFNIPFLAANFNKVDQISTADKSELAHIEIVKGNYSNAVEMLNELSTDSPFALYYMGVAKQDKEILTRSYHSFIEERSDYFFSKLPLRALRRMSV